MVGAIKKGLRGAETVELKDKPSSKNLINDNLWVIIDEISEEAIILNWKIFWGYSEKTHWAQLLLLKMCSGYADDQNTILCRKNTLYEWLQGFKAFSIFWKTKFENKELREWTLDDLLEYLRSEIYSNGKLLGRGKADLLIKLVRYIENYYPNHLPDGFTFIIPLNLHQIAYENLVQKEGLEYNIWKKGGTFSELPIAESILLLKEAINIVRSKESQELQAMFSYWRSSYSISPKTTFMKKSLESFWANSNNQILYKKFLKGEIKKQRQEITNNFNIRKTIEEKTGEQFITIPWENSVEFTDKVNEIYSASFFILVCITGARISELIDITPNDFEVDSSGTYWVKNKIHKTNLGLKTIRSISGICYETITVLNNLSHVNKEKYNLPIFSKNIRDSDYQFVHNRPTNKYIKQEYDIKRPIYASETTLRTYLNKFYNAAKIKYPNFSWASKTLSPHMLRHTWAEFALRRFDGNVLEEIRHHFRHSYHSFMTRRYTDGKLGSEIINSKEKEYFNEILQRIGNKSNSLDLYGPAVLYIRKIIGENFSILEPNEIEERIQKLNSQFLKFEAHEWGFCVLNKETESLSKCYDKSSGIAQTKDKGNFENCSVCIHRLSMKSQKPNIERIAIQAQNFVNNFPLPIVGSLQKNVLIQATNILKEMGDD